MARRQTKTLEYITDGTFSMDDVRAALSAAGELVEDQSGEARFVPDDPSFPTTTFRADGRIEFRVDPADEPRLETYLSALSSWLGVSLQRVDR